MLLAAGKKPGSLEMTLQQPQVRCNERQSTKNKEWGWPEVVPSSAVVKTEEMFEFALLDNPPKNGY